MSNSTHGLRVLVVDDEHVDELAQAFTDMDTVDRETYLAGAVAAATKVMPDLVVLDVMFPRELGSGCEFLAGKFLEQIQQLCERNGLVRPTVLLVSGQKEAAARFQEVAKWLSDGRIRDILPKSLAGIGWEFFRAVLGHKVARIRDELVWRPIRLHLQQAQAALERHGIITCNPDLLGTWEKITSPLWVSAAYPVLIRGETGTGKDLLAKAIQKTSSRSDGPMVSLNVTTIHKELLQSELFGYVANSGISGADPQGKPGLFEVADGGTIFLDEIGDLSPELQVQLLRVLQEGTIRRISALQETKVDVRVITATHRDLGRAIAAGTFRADLFGRIALMKVDLPPLRDRPNDIGLLVAHFIKTIARAGGPFSLASEVIQVLQQYDWPLNVRELFALVLEIALDYRTLESVLDLATLRSRYTKEQQPCLYPVTPPHPSPSPSPPPPPPPAPDADELDPSSIDRLQADDLAMWGLLDDRYMKPIMGTLKALLSADGLARLAALDQGISEHNQTDPAPFHMYKALLFFALHARQVRKQHTHERVQSVLGLGWGQADKVLMALAGIREKRRGSRPAQHFVMASPFLSWEQSTKPPTFGLLPVLSG